MFKRISSSQKPEQHSVFDRYVKVTKPGIIMGNLISVAGGTSSLLAETSIGYLCW